MCRPPLRGRGSKPPTSGGCSPKPKSPPPAGAWIETNSRVDCCARPRVAPPCGGVDRNTIATDLPDGGGRRPPLRGRGSKRHLPIAWLGHVGSPPPAGAWIETSRSCSFCLRRLRRPPLRGRGSKHERKYRPAPAGRRPPLRGRGSKRVDHGSGSSDCRSPPPAGAWIETRPRRASDSIAGRRPPLRGRGSKQRVTGGLERGQCRPPLRGRGSKRFQSGASDAGGPSPPPAGAWIETHAQVSVPVMPSVAPPCGGVDRNVCAGPVCNGGRVSPPPAGAWIETPAFRRSSVC